MTPVPVASWNLQFEEFSIGGEALVVAPTAAAGTLAEVAVTMPVAAAAVGLAVSGAEHVVAAVEVAFVDLAAEPVALEVVSTLHAADAVFAGQLAIPQAVAFSVVLLHLLHFANLMCFLGLMKLGHHQYPCRCRSNRPQYPCSVT